MIYRKSCAKYSVCRSRRRIDNGFADDDWKRRRIVKKYPYRIINICISNSSIIFLLSIVLSFLFYSSRQHRFFLNSVAWYTDSVFLFFNNIFFFYNYLSVVFDNNNNNNNNDWFFSIQITEYTCSFIRLT
jgi:hypothetical protein